MSSLNKATIIGNLGDDPDVRSMQSGEKVVNLSIATSESWKDKDSGERKEKTQWHRVVVFNPGLIKVCENYLKKGSKVYIEGQIETRSWESDGQRKYTTEIVLRPYRSELKMLDSRSSDGSEQSTFNGQVAGSSPAASTTDELEDQIPF